MKEKLHPDLEVLVTPLDPDDATLSGQKIPVISFGNCQDFPLGSRLLLSEKDFLKLQELFGSDLIERRIVISAADDGVRLRIRMVAS